MTSDGSEHAPETVQCPECDSTTKHYPCHRNGEHECLNNECWLGSFYLNGDLTKMVSNDTQQNKEVSEHTNSYSSDIDSESARAVAYTAAIVGAVFITGVPLT